MKLGPTLATILSGLCISFAVASAQSAICGGDGEANTNAAPVACVTGAGAQVTAASTARAQWEAPPLAPEQRPAEVPNVTYIDGKLRVVAKNAILSDILKAIAAKTGAAIEIPEGANERVVSQLGPAPPRDVIAALLNGSHYNYVLVGTEANSAEVARVIVTAKTEKADTGAALAAVAPGVRSPAMIQPRNALQAAVMQPYQEMQQQQQAQQAAAQEMQAQIASEITEQGAQGVSNDAAATAPAATTPAPASTPDAGSASAPAEAPAAEAPPASSSDKTPQQILQDLYETRRQMIIQQHQPPPNQQ